MLVPHRSCISSNCLCTGQPGQCFSSNMRAYRLRHRCSQMCIASTAPYTCELWGLCKVSGQQSRVRVICNIKEFYRPALQVHTIFYFWSYAVKSSHTRSRLSCSRKLLSCWRLLLHLRCFPHRRTLINEGLTSKLGLSLTIAQKAISGSKIPRRLSYRYFTVMVLFYQHHGRLPNWLRHH